MPYVAALQGHELVTHVFVAADGPDAGADRRWLLDLWHRCGEEFALDSAVAPFPRDPSEDLSPTSVPGGVVAALGRTGPGVHQAVLRRLREVIVLSVVRSPAEGDPCGWPELKWAWEKVTRPPSQGVIGMVRILQARLADPTAELDPTALGSVVAKAAGTPGLWSATGVIRQVETLGPFATWEIVGLSPPADWDARAERRLVVLAQADRDDRLSAWTWSRGTPELAPFANYLLHAAKVRYGLRVWAAAADRALRGAVDADIGPFLRLTEKVAASGREPDVSALSAASATCPASGR